VQSGEMGGAVLNCMISSISSSTNYISANGSTSNNSFDFRSSRACRFWFSESNVMSVYQHFFSLMKPMFEEPRLPRQLFVSKDINVFYYI
jgi:hypothetical protein